MQGDGECFTSIQNLLFSVHWSVPPQIILSSCCSFHYLHSVLFVYSASWHSGWDKMCYLHRFDFSECDRIATTQCVDSSDWLFIFTLGLFSFQSFCVLISHLSAPNDNHSLDGALLLPTHPSKSRAHCVLLSWQCKDMKHLCDLKRARAKSSSHLNKVTVNICAQFHVETAFQVIWVPANVLANFSFLWQIHEQLQWGKTDFSSQIPMLGSMLDQCIPTPKNQEAEQR